MSSAKTPGSSISRLGSSRTGTARKASCRFQLWKRRADANFRDCTGGRKNKQSLFGDRAAGACRNVYFVDLSLPPLQQIQNFVLRYRAIVQLRSCEPKP